MRWVIEQFTEPGDMVLDPYMGSGPVAQACKETGRGYLGIEIEATYCEAAVARLSQDALFDGVAA
jgi:site-specific DNA-methyltransferase (adenine-specific)